MNIFYLNADPSKCARDHCDKHVCKMIIEYAQLLSTAHHVLDGEDAPDNIYKKTHVNHPSAVWARQNRDNYLWLYVLFIECLAEYKRRYVRDHATSRLRDTLSSPPNNIPDGELTVPPQCMPDHYKRDDAIQAYRAYYVGDKAGFARWRYSDTPTWYSAALYASA